MPYLLVAIGIVGLYLGGELLVRNASRLASALGVPPIAIGLTVVAFGTSSPELAATIAAALSGATDIAIGNVIGSNIANVGLILGLTALVYPLTTRWGFVRREIPFMVGATILTMALALDGRIGRIEGVLLLTGLLVFVVVAFRDAGGSPGDPEEARERRSGGVGRSLALAVVGVGVLVGAAQALVTGAVELAVGWGVSQRVIGLTLVAVGTSLPELASSLVAALRRETDIILGNVIGSNVFNLLCVLSLAALVRPLEVDAAAVRVDALVMLAFALVVIPIAITGLRVGRREGGLLLAAYAAYVVVIFL